MSLHYSSPSKLIHHPRNSSTTTSLSEYLGVHCCLSTPRARNSEINGMSPVSRGAGLGEADTPKANTEKRVSQNETEMNTKDSECKHVSCAQGS